MIEGLDTSRNIKITNLQYADDTTIFGQLDIQQVIITKWILKTFEIWSELKINCEKSQILILGDRDINMMIIERIMRHTRG